MRSSNTLSYLLISVALLYAFVYPAYDEIGALLGEKNKYQETLDKVADIENKKSELLTQFNSISEADKKNIEIILPDSLNYVKLISDIDAIASKYGISIDKVVKTEVGSPSGSVAEEVSTETYKSGIIGFSFTSSYQRFNDFISELEGSLRILDMKSLRISAQEGGLYLFEVEFEAYWYEE